MLGAIFEIRNSNFEFAILFLTTRCCLAREASLTGTCVAKFSYARTEVYSNEEKT